MLFNSIEFILFLPVVFFLYWFVTQKNLRAQNILLLAASYVFYGWWDFRFLSLIVLSTVVDYLVGLKIWENKEKAIRKRWLIVSIGFNLSLLGFFKYYNFFIESWAEAFKSIGYEMNPWTLSIILPVGISFYTFQTMSYSLDIYKNKLEPTKNFIGFAAFVAFFPQLVAGPIERASSLLPQILSKRTFSSEQAKSGIRLIIWGMFKKVVIADSLAGPVNDIFANYADYSGLTLLLGAIFFAFQIYCDFSGYSDIAIGTAKLFGIQLMTNFNFPYFSRSIGEFWRRWHISLSTWFRDYLYIPLGGSRVGKWKGIRNVFVIFLVSGFWHGANWTFIVWGGIHAILFIPSFIMGTNRRHVEPINSNNYNLLSTIGELSQILLTFTMVTFAWVFFRAENISIAFDYISTIFSSTFGASHTFIAFLFYPILLIALEVFYTSTKIDRAKSFGATLFYLFCLTFALVYFDSSVSEFIYFQF